MQETAGLGSIRDRIGQRTDWLVSTVRWTLLAVMLFRLEIGGGVASHDLTTFMILALLGGASAVQMLLRFLSYAPPGLPTIALLIDVTLCLILFQVTGGMSGPLTWVMIYPALTAALRHSWPIALLVAAAGLAAQAVLIGATGASLTSFWLIAGVVLLATGGAALAGAQTALKGDTGPVTSGLGVAFNSTFVALIISIILMYVIHELQLRQERLVLDIEQNVDDTVDSNLQSR